MDEWQSRVGGSREAELHSVASVAFPSFCCRVQLSPRVRRAQEGAQQLGSPALNGPVSAEWKCTVFSIHLVWVSSVWAPLTRHHNRNRQLHSGCHSDLQPLFIFLPRLLLLCVASPPSPVTGTDELQGDIDLSVWCLLLSIGCQSVCNVGNVNTVSANLMEIDRFNTNYF